MLLEDVLLLLVSDLMLLVDHLLVLVDVILPLVSLVVGHVRVAQTLISKLGSHQRAGGKVVGAILLILKLLGVNAGLGGGGCEKLNGLLGVRLLHSCEGEGSAVCAGSSQALRGVLHEAVDGGVSLGQGGTSVEIAFIGVSFEGSVLVLRRGVGASLVDLKRLIFIKSANGSLSKFKLVAKGDDG